MKLEFPETIQVSKTFNGSNILLLQYFLWKHWDVFIQNITLFNGSNLGNFSNFPLLHSENGLLLSSTLMKWHKNSQHNFTLLYFSSNIDKVVRKDSLHLQWLPSHITGIAICPIDKVLTKIWLHMKVTNNCLHTSTHPEMLHDKVLYIFIASIELDRCFSVWRSWSVRIFPFIRVFILYFYF